MNNKGDNDVIPLLLYAFAAFLLIAPFFCGLCRAEEEWVAAKALAPRIAGYDLSDYSIRQDIVFTFEGETFVLDKPSLVKGSDIWIPVEGLLKKLNLIYLKIEDSRFSVIRDDGTPLEFKTGSKDATVNKLPFISLEYPPAVYDGVFMLSLRPFCKALDIEGSYNEAAKTVELAKPKVEELETFTIEKSPEELEKERVAAIPPKPPPPQMPIDIMEEPLPEKYRRDIDLHLDANISYLETKDISDRTRQLEFYLTGRAYKYNLDGRYRMKDFRTTNKERFKQDGEYFGISTRDLRLNFMDNFFTVPTLRSQSMRYFGVESSYYHGPFKSVALYGKTDNTVSGPAAVGAVRYYGDLTVLRNIYKAPSGIFKTDESIIMWQNHARHTGQSGTTTFPRRDFTFVTDNVVTPYKGLDLSCAYAISNFAPDNRVNDRFIDDNWKLGAAFRQERYSFAASYEFVGQQYASVGLPSTYQDFQGLDASTSYNFTNNWSATMNAQLYRNNVERNPRVPTTFTRNLGVSSTVGLPWEQSLGVGWSINESISRGGDQDMSGNRYQDYRLDYNKMWGTLTAQLTLDHYNMDPFAANAGSGSTTDSASISLFDVYPQFNNSYWRIYQSYRKVKNLAVNSYTTEYGDTSLTGRLNITTYLSASADWKISYTLREAFQDTALMTLDIGAEFRSSPVTTFNFNFTLTTFDLYNRKTWLPKHYTLLLRGRHLFDYFTSDKWGRVSAFVYKDEDGNGEYDPGEPLIRDVRVYVSGGRAALTNEKGRAIIDKVLPGERQVKLDLSTLPLDFVVRGQSVKALTVESLKTAKVDYPIVRTGTIRGRVYIDTNNDGVYERLADEPIPNARIYLDPLGRDTLAFSDGSYYFDYTYPGDYNVCIDPEGIPTGVKLKTAETIHVTLKEDEMIEGVDFVFSPRPVEVQYVEGE